MERVELGTPYPDVVEHVSGLVADDRLAGCTLVPCRLMPVMITGGSHDTPGPTGGYHVPRREVADGIAGDVR